MNYIKTSVLTCIIATSVSSVHADWKENISKAAQQQYETISTSVCNFVSEANNDPRQWIVIVPSGITTLSGLRRMFSETPSIRKFTLGTVMAAVGIAGVLLSKETIEAYDEIKNS